MKFDKYTKQKRMAQFKNGFDWMDAVVVVCCSVAVILGIALLAYNISRIL